MVMAKQQALSYWDIARMSKMPGASITTEIDPKHWTVRTKNAVKRMIRTGFITGGHSSVSAALARAVAKQYFLDTTNCYSACQVSAVNLDDESVTFITELLDADIVARRMGVQNSYHSYYLDNAIRNRQNIIDTRTISYYFLVTEYAQQVRDHLAKKRSPEMKQRAQRACDALDANEIIYINQYGG